MNLFVIYMILILAGTQASILVGALLTAESANGTKTYLMYVAGQNDFINVF